MGTPGALIATQSKDKLHSICEKAVVNPIFRVRLTIQCGGLNIDILVLPIKVTRLDGRGLVCQWRSVLYRFKERWDDEVDVLGRVGKQSHH